MVGPLALLGAVEKSGPSDSSPVFSGSSAAGPSSAAPPPLVEISAIRNVLDDWCCKQWRVEEARLRQAFEGAADAVQAATLHDGGLENRKVGLDDRREEETVAGLGELKVESGRVVTGSKDQQCGRKEEQMCGDNRVASAEVSLLRRVPWVGRRAPFANLLALEGRAGDCTEAEEAYLVETGPLEGRSQVDACQLVVLFRRRTWSFPVSLARARATQVLAPFQTFPSRTALCRTCHAQPSSAALRI